MGLDIETSGLSLAQDRIRLVQFGDSEHGWAVPWGLYSGVVREAIAKYEGPIVGHHLKFDASFLMRAGVRFNWRHAHDTLMMAALTDSLGPKGLKPAAGRYVDRKARAGQQELKQAMARNGWDYGSVPITLPTYWGYAAGDPVLTARLAEALWADVQPYREAYDLELACAQVLCGMELRGVRIDVPYCQDQLYDLEIQLEKLLAELHPINPNSAPQVVDTLEALGVPLTKLTEAGNVSVDDEVLAGLVDSFPDLNDPVRRLASTIREARDVQKLISAFFSNFLKYREDDILHAHFNQMAARTHRMSVSEPALQQVPKTRLVRDAFIPREGRGLVVADYDNQEVRLAAHYSRDPELLSAFAEDPPRDLHKETARRVYNTEPTSRQRAVGKQAFFALSYGAGVKKFAQTTGLPEEDAARVFATIGELYPGLKYGMAMATRKVRERAAEEKAKTGWVQLPDGRRLRVQAEKAYKGWNFLIQGTGSVIMKRALVDLDRAGLGEYLNLTVHDEVHLDVPTSEVEEVAKQTTEIMRSDEFSIPITASAEILERWGDKYHDE